MKPNLLKAKNFAENLAKKAGKFLLENQEKVKITEYKNRQDICTNVDLAVEKVAIKTIEKKYPTHNILSEEKGLIDKNGEYTWVIDPLDGTKEYIRKMYTFNTTLSLWKGEKILLGIVYRPIEDELFSAIKGRGAYCNNKKLNVSSQEVLANSFVFSYLPNYKLRYKDFKNTWTFLGKILRKSFRLRGASDVVTTLSWVAAGRIEAFLTQEQKLWDVAAGILMVEEAGGKATDTKGRPIKIKNGKVESIIASNGKIHEQILKVINT